MIATKLELAVYDLSKAWGASNVERSELGELIINRELERQIEDCCKLARAKIEEMQLRISRKGMKGRRKLKLELPSRRILELKLTKLSKRALAKELQINRGTLERRLKEG